MQDFFPEACFDPFTFINRLLTRTRVVDMKILITGASGYIGSALTKKLHEENKHTIYSLDVDSLPRELENSTNQIKADLTDFNELEEKLNDTDVDIAVHLAAMVRGKPSEVVKINVLGAMNLLEIMRRKNPQLMIVASTAAQLYRNAQYTPVDERHPITPVTPYGMSKQLAEIATNYSHRVHQIPTLIFRQSNVYGQSPNQKPTVINKFIELAKGEGSITVYGDGTQIRNFIHIDDLIEFYMRAINSKKPEVLAGETMNIGGPEQYQIKEIADMIVNFLGKEIEIRNAPLEIPPESEVYLFKLSTEKAKSLLDYQPNVTVREGIKRIIRGR